MVEFEGGAKRNDAKPMYRKMPYGPMRRRAVTYTEGSLKYDEGVHDANWKKGNEEFAAACFDHVIDHLYLWISGDRSEDHLAHAAVGCDFLMEFEDTGVFIPGGIRPEDLMPTEATEVTTSDDGRITKVLQLLGLKN